MLPGKTLSPKMRSCRAAKSGSLIFFVLAGGGGDKRAMILPFLTISTCSPSATQFITLPKSCRRCRTLAGFTLYNYVTLEGNTPTRGVNVFLGAAGPGGGQNAH